MIIIIADDNTNIRFALKSMLLDILDEEETTFFEANDGLELVELCTSINADLAFVDIKMPNMDGLTAIKKVKDQCESTSFVILSGFSDFEYAKKSISLGVSDYLLKPVDDEDLKELIDKIYQEKVQNSLYESSKLQAQVLNINSYLPLLGDSFSFNEESLLDDYIYLLINFIFYYPKDFNKRKIEFKYTKLINMPKRLKKELPINVILCHLNSSPNNVQCLLKIKKNDKEEILKAIEENVLFIEEYPSVIVKALYQENKLLVPLLKENAQLQSNTYLALDKKSYSCSPVEKRSQEENNYLSQLSQLYENAQDNDGLEYLVVLEKFKKDFKSIPPEINVYEMVKSVGNFLNLPLESHTHKDIILALENNKIFNKENTNDLVTKMKKYVEKNYMNNFGINEVAQSLDFSPNYLSAQFHKITGIYFVNYLNTYRLEKAKHLLLANSSASIKDIAMLVGYSNARYFSTLYKQAYKELPTTYRKKYLNK